MSSVTVRFLCAECLPKRKLFGLPSPQLAVELYGVSSGHDRKLLETVDSLPECHTIAPAWNFCKTFAIADKQVNTIEVDVQVSDESCGGRTRLLGKCRIVVDAAYCEGEFDLKGEGGGGMISAKIEWDGWAERAPHDSSLLKKGEDVVSVSKEPGRLFRCGTLEVCVNVFGIPHDIKHPFVVCKLPDQKLISKKVQDNGKKDEAANASRSGVEKIELENTKYRNVDFGAFQFALLQGTLPKRLTVSLKDRKHHMVHSVTELKVDLTGVVNHVTLHQYDPSVRRSVYTLRAPTGSKNHLPRFEIVLTSHMHAPQCVNDIVTSRFRTVLNSIDSIASEFKYSYPHAQRLTYLFVGGLFTSHYPGYFERNIRYLRDVLKLPKVDRVLVNTEGSVDGNAFVIKRAVQEAAKGRPKSVVLIGHSKGGVDLCAAISSYSELISDLLYGCVLLQAPYNGTHLVDLITKSKAAFAALQLVVKRLWGGEPEAFLTMSYNFREKLITADTAVKAIKAVDMSPPSPSSCSSSVEESLMKVPIVCLTSYAPFSISTIRSMADAAGIAAMRISSSQLTNFTGFFSDGLVIPADGRVPGADCVLVDEMYHSDPALYVPGTKYPPGQLTASLLVLLFEKASKPGRTADGTTKDETHEKDEIYEG